MFYCSLLETQTTVALMRTELGQLRTQYEQKCQELDSERVRSLQVINNQDQLETQLHLLQYVCLCIQVMIYGLIVVYRDANRKLQDANDSIKNSMNSNQINQVAVSD